MNSFDSKVQPADERSSIGARLPSGGLASPQRMKVQRFVGVMLGVYWGLLFLSTHVTFSSEGPTIPGADKIVHSVGYGILGLLLSLWIAYRRRLSGKVLVMIVAAIGLYGILDELLQIPVGRECDPLDWCADLVGASCGAGVMAWVSHSRQ